MPKLKTQLSLEVLLKQCTKDDNIKKYLNDIKHANDELIHEIFRYQKLNCSFSRRLELKNTGEVIGYIGPSYEEYLRSICLFLNVPIDKEIVDDEELTKKLNLRLLILNGIKTETELKKEFPYIYNDLMLGRKVMAQIIEKEQKEPRNDNFYEEQKHYYYRCGLRRKLSTFITTQTQVYRRFIERRNSYKELANNRNYNHYFMKYFDKDKIAFYAAYSFLEEAKKHNEDKDEYLKIVEKYLKSNYNKYITIKINEQQVSLREIVRDYINEKYNQEFNLQDVLSTRELLDLVKSLEEEQVNWVMIPSGKAPTKFNNESPKNYRTLQLSEYELENLRKKGEEKQTFYENTNYLGRIIGLAKYKGYIGYIYPNGEILLDTKYNSKKPKTATGAAIYNLKVDDFETLSKLDKIKLMHHQKVKRIIHSKNWQDKVTEIIERKATTEEIDKSKQLIKKIQKKEA